MPQVCSCCSAAPRSKEMGAQVLSIRRTVRTWPLRRSESRQELHLAEQSLPLRMSLPPPLATRAFPWQGGTDGCPQLPTEELELTGKPPGAELGARAWRPLGHNERPCREEPPQNESCPHRMGGSELPITRDVSTGTTINYSEEMTE